MRAASTSKAEFLTAGGIPTAVASHESGHLSRDRVEPDRHDHDRNDGRPSSVSRLTGPLPHARWYSSGVLLPTGEVFAVSGADRDEVATPGLGFAGEARGDLRSADRDLARCRDPEQPAHLPQHRGAPARRPRAGRRTCADHHGLSVPHRSVEPGLLAQRRARSLVRDLQPAVHVPHPADDHERAGVGERAARRSASTRRTRRASTRRC